jgi:clan AA aspartic protease
MGYESGAVTDKDEARLLVRIAGGSELECVIDTAFNGALMLPRMLIEDLKLPMIDRIQVGWIGDEGMIMDACEGRLVWLGLEREVEILINDGNDALLGALLLEGTRLTIDYVARTVLIETVDP